MILYYNNGGIEFENNKLPGNEGNGQPCH